MVEVGDAAFTESKRMVSFKHPAMTETNYFYHQAGDGGYSYCPNYNKVVQLLLGPEYKTFDSYKCEICGIDMGYAGE